VSNNPALEYLDCSSAASYYTTSLTFLNVNNNPAMKHLDCFGNNLTTLDVSASPMLEYLDCSKNRLTFLDVSNNPALKYLDCNSGGVGVWLAALNVSNNPALEYLDCSGHYTLVSLDISKNPALEYLNCGNGRLAALDVSNNPALVTLRCFYSSLTSLNVSNSPALEYLDCSANYQITSLDVSNNPALEYLDCNNGRLTSLDVSTSPALEYLDCSNNYLSSLNANTRPALVTLDCYNNQLATLDVSGDSALVTLNCYNNRFLDVSGLPDTLQYFSGLSQAVTVSVHANSASPGSYLSNAIYDFGTHTITLNSTDADFGSPNGLFITTVLDTPVNFVTDAGAGHRISGTVTFAATSPSSDKDITSFTLAGVAGTIERTSINVTVPHGTDVTSLVPVIAHTGANISPAGAQDFTSPVTYTVTAEDATTKSYTVTVTVLAEPVAQHGGKDRYDTAVKASQKAYPDPSKVDAVVLAYSYNFPDALAASYLAGALDAPILLSDTSDIDDTTVAEIKRLSPSIIYIVGGTGAISANIENALEAYDFTPSVVRLGGAGREETAYEIANAAKEMRGVPSVAFIADAANFPDALSAGSLSAGQGVPILLTATGSLDEWTQRFLEENDISDIIIVGGPGSVSETVATQLRALSHNPAVTRWSGSDRYATSADVLTKAIAKWNLTPAIIGLASGEGFPDALVGGAAVGNRGGLLAITDPDTLSAAAEGVISTYKDGISDVEIFGGTGTIRVADKVQGLLA
jgi:putative cell wall-binding protein